MISGSSAIPSPRWTSAAFPTPTVDQRDGSPMAKSIRRFARGHLHDYDIDITLCDRSLGCINSAAPGPIGISWRKVMLASPAIEAPQTLGFLLLPQFSMMAFVSAVEPLRVANRL